MMDDGCKISSFVLVRRVDIIITIIRSQVIQARISASSPFLPQTGQLGASLMIIGNLVIDDL